MLSKSCDVVSLNVLNTSLVTGAGWTDSVGPAPAFGRGPANTEGGPRVAALTATCGTRFVIGGEGCGVPPGTVTMTSFETGPVPQEFRPRTRTK